VRRIVGCYVAAFALCLGLEALHRDRDFEVIASVTGLRAVSTLER